MAAGLAAWRAGSLEMAAGACCARALGSRANVRTARASMTRDMRIGRGMEGLFGECEEKSIGIWRGTPRKRQAHADLAFKGFEDFVV